MWQGDSAVRLWLSKCGAECKLLKRVYENKVLNRNQRGWSPLQMKEMYKKIVVGQDPKE
jgi:hypothetical protein